MAPFRPNCAKAGARATHHSRLRGTFLRAHAGRRTGLAPVVHGRQCGVALLTSGVPALTARLEKARSALHNGKLAAGPRATHQISSRVLPSGEFHATNAAPMVVCCIRLARQQAARLRARAVCSSARTHAHLIGGKVSCRQPHDKRALSRARLAECADLDGLWLGSGGRHRELAFRQALKTLLSRNDASWYCRPCVSSAGRISAARTLNRRCAQRVHEAAAQVPSGTHGACHRSESHRCEVNARLNPSGCKLYLSLLAAGLAAVRICRREEANRHEVAAKLPCTLTRRHDCADIHLTQLAARWFG